MRSVGGRRRGRRQVRIGAPDPSLTANDGFAAVVLADIARQSYDLGSSSDGLELVQLAQYGTRKTAESTLRALLATREAWAYAQSGQVRPFRRAAGLAEEHYADDDRRASDRWTSLDQAELYGVIGARYRDLAQHDPKQARTAQDYIIRAIELRNPSRVRNRCFDLIGLARAYLITAEPDRACELIGDVLPIARPWAIGRVGVKLGDFYHESEQFGSAPMVKHTREAIRDLVTL